MSAKDFKAQIADLTIPMIQYQILTWRIQIKHYESKGSLFAHAKGAIIQFRGLLMELVKIIETIFEGVDSYNINNRFLNDEKPAV